MKTFFSLFILIALILLLATIAFHGFQYETKKAFFSIFPIFAWKSVDQPILFNHLIHKEKVNLNCTFCHRYVEGYRAAGIPNIEICRICHSSEVFSKRPEALKVFEYVKAGKEIPWVRMYELPKFVVFPHWIHIQSGVDCAICHGFTGVRERPVKMVDRDYMEWCVDCHKKRGADIDCYTCHSS
jgi:hypothetical protein